MKELVLITGLESNYKWITDRAHGQTILAGSPSSSGFKLQSFPTSHWAGQESIIEKAHEPSTSDQKFHSYLILIFRGLQLKGYFLRNPEHTHMQFQISYINHSKIKTWNIKLIFSDVSLDLVHTIWKHIFQVNLSNFLLCKSKTKLEPFSTQKKVVWLQDSVCLQKIVIHSYYLL